MQQEANGAKTNKVCPKHRRRSTNEVFAYFTESNSAQTLPKQQGGFEI